MVVTSRSRGTLVSASGFAVSSAAHMIGSAAFFAPETRTSPSSGRPPVIACQLIHRLLPLLGRERLHRQRVDLLAHALAERRVDELVALHAALAGELRRETITAWKCWPSPITSTCSQASPASMPLLHAFGSHHLSVLSL